jgi:prepilin-type N-terminal cleavage/methylation domain-containing protein
MDISGSLISLKRLRDDLRSKPKGFTLVEMVVTIGIITLLLTSMSISGTSIKREFALAKGQEELRSLITYARFLSVATLAAPEGELVCGYGVHIVPAENRAFIVRDEGTGGVCVSGIGEILTPLFSQGTLYSMTLDPLVAFDSPDQIIDFIPPDPLVFFNPPAKPDGSVVITLKARNESGSSRQIQCLASGMVSIVR